jgi:hypothetical protein
VLIIYSWYVIPELPVVDSANKLDVVVSLAGSVVSLIAAFCIKEHIL